VTRELKLALIIAVTLILSVMVLISDHLSVQRRPVVASEVAVQPDRVPPPPVVEAPAPVASTVGDALDGMPAEPAADQAADQATDQGSSTTVAMGETDEHTELAKAIERVGGTVKDGEIVIPENATKVKSPVVELTQETPAGPAPKSTAAGKSTTSGPKGRTHVVAPGDSAFKIARQYLGDGKYWKQIKEANPKAFANDAELKVGTEIVIPEVRQAAPKAAPAPVTPAKSSPTRLAQDPKSPTTKTVATKSTVASKGKDSSKGKQYTIRKGDTLHAIAKRELGSSGRVDEIMRMNRGVIKDPTTLPLGVAIVLPSDR